MLVTPPKLSSQITSNTPRKYLCLPLLENSISPLTTSLESSITCRIQEIFDIDKLTTKARTYAPNLWSFTILHGKARKQRVATYEEDGPGSVRYTPRQRFHIVVDGTNRYMYVASNQRDRAKLLIAIQDTLFPKTNTPLSSVKFNLDIINGISDTIRHPMNGMFPWYSLGLLFVKNAETCDGDDPQTHLFNTGDGFEKLENNSYQWPRYVEEIRMNCRVPNLSNPFKIGLFNQTGLINTTLTLHSLDAVAGIVNLCSEEGELIPQTYMTAQQLQLNFF